MANSRVARGRLTQRLVAQWFRAHGWPSAKSVEAFLPGVDVNGVSNYAIEVKATTKTPILEALQQARRNSEADQVPVVVWRPNGYGETRIGEWVVAMTLNDFTTMAQHIEGKQQ